MPLRHPGGRRFDGRKIKNHLPQPVYRCMLSWKFTGILAVFCKTSWFKLKEHRRFAIILVFGLVVLTVLACLPYAPQGPFDARNHTRLSAMRLEQHPWTAPIEPLFAPLLIIAGAPNFKIAALVTLVWVFFGAALWGMFTEFRSQEEKRPFAILTRGVLSALIAVSTLLVLIFFFVMARVPGWRLVDRDPGQIVADLHSHTIMSHDGLMSTLTNLKLHASCGYDMEAMTEHFFLVGHKVKGVAPAAIGRLPAILSGVEVHAGARAIVIGLVKKPTAKLEKSLILLLLFPASARFEGGSAAAGKPMGRLALFAKKIHEDGQGAVLVVTLKNLKTSDITRLADDGVDAFEIANCGHPDLPLRLRRQVLATCRSRGLVLLADTDWHGWTGLTRTWNVIRTPGGAALPRSERADFVLQKLREHDSADFIPVVAGYMGAPSLARAVFSPFVETARYAMELSPGRVISWWLWAWAVFFLWVFLEKKGFSPGDILPASLVIALGIGLVFAGVSLIWQGTGRTDFGYHIGLITIAVGALALGIATFRWVGFIRRRKCVTGMRPF